MTTFVDYPVRVQWTTRDGAIVAEEALSPPRPEAQADERRTPNAEAAGSNPVGSTR